MYTLGLSLPRAILRLGSDVYLALWWARHEAQGGGARFYIIIKHQTYASRQVRYVFQFSCIQTLTLYASNSFAQFAPEVNHRPLAVLVLLMNYYSN